MNYFTIEFISNNTALYTDVTAGHLVPADFQLFII